MVKCNMQPWLGIVFKLTIQFRQSELKVGQFLLHGQPLTVTIITACNYSKRYPFN